MNSGLDFEFLATGTLQILTALPVTLRLAFIPMVLGTILGLMIAIVRIYKLPLLTQICAVYVSFLRGTPALVQLFLVFYGLPALILAIGQSTDAAFFIDFNKIPAEWFAIAAFTMNTSAYTSETLRSAIESVDRGQLEAAHSIGLSATKVMLRIVLPQAALNALPNLGNTLISLVKDTSIAFMIMVVDIMGMAKILGSRSLQFLEVYVSVSLIYWVVCIILELALRIFERRIGVSRRSLAA
jgi:L-cystine transport system permease protein